MIDSPTLVAALIGGFLGIGASVGGVELARRRQADQWQRELLASACSGALKAVQRYMREILNIAFSEATRYRRELVDGVEQVFPDGQFRDPLQEATFDRVVSDWNSSMHELLIVAPPELISLSRKIDCELDRLLDLAIEERWSREGFRSEREAVGQLIAQFANQARHSTGAARVALDNVWTWADNA